VDIPSHLEAQHLPSSSLVSSISHAAALHHRKALLAVPYQITSQGPAMTEEAELTAVHVDIIITMMCQFLSV